MYIGVGWSKVVLADGLDHDRLGNPVFTSTEFVEGAILNCYDNAMIYLNR